VSNDYISACSFDSSSSKFLVGICRLFQLAEDDWEFENIVLERVSTFEWLSTCDEPELLIDSCMVMGTAVIPR